MRTVVIGLLAALLLPVAIVAQTRSETTFFPMVIYPGENIVTVTNDAGIERIRFRSSPNVRVVVPQTLGCPTTVDVTVFVDDAVSNETVTFTVHDCNGTFGATAIGADNWTILHHRIGPVVIGDDSCSEAMVSIEGENAKVIDSIVSSDPTVRVDMPAQVGGRWAATTGQPLPYRICFTPAAADTHTTQLALHIRRQYPHKGLTSYVIYKPVTVIGIEPEPPPEPEEPDAGSEPGVPPLVDPTTFRNIVMPSAETLPQGTFFAGNFDIAGWLGGYGITDDVMVLFGGAFIPEFVQEVALGTIGAKYRPLKIGPVEASVGAQYAYSSSETDISAFAPYVVVSVGNRANRFTIAGGYAWKTHTNDVASFDENASVFAVGGDVTVKRGWKIAAETYFIEKSGLQPIALTSRWFGERFAFDIGLIVDLEGTSGVQASGTLSGEIQEIRAAPLLSLIMVF